MPTSESIQRTLAYVNTLLVGVCRYPEQIQLEQAVKEPYIFIRGRVALSDYEDIKYTELYGAITAIVRQAGVVCTDERGAPLQVVFQLVPSEELTYVDASPVALPSAKAPSHS